MVAQVQSNAMTFDDVLGAAKQLGAETGMGKDTQVKMLLKIAEAAYHGAIDGDMNKYGTSVDDSVKLAEAYVKAQGSATMFDAKAPNQRVLVSKFRKMREVGQWAKGGVGEPLGTINNLMTIRQKLRADPATAKKLDDAANTLLRYARAQTKRDDLIPQDELPAFCFRKGVELSTAEEIIEAQRNGLRKLKEGKAAQNTAQDASPEIDIAIAALTKRLKDIAVQRGQGGTVKPKLVLASPAA